ncbi:MAG: NADH:flavin oxidoreductase [Dehalococcoidia bacterium]|nr:NADH:flavin oxidoreductase [Dehalococcoidia bacterium]
MRLLEPVTIGGMRLKNRVVMPAMFVNLGLRGRRARAFYVERARGGVAAIVTQGISVDLLISDEPWRQADAAAAFVKGMRSLTDAVHAAGARIGPQLFHANRFPSGMGLEDARGEPVAPSASDDIYYRGAHSGLPPKTPCRALTAAEIETIILRFGQAARAALEAGFDFIEINASNGQLCSQFFSPADNRRTDKFGGDIARRMTFGLECVMAMRIATSGDLPVIFRIGAYDEKTGGATLADNVAFALELEKAGVAALNIGVGAPADPRRYWIDHVAPTSDRPLGLLADFAAAFKRKVNVPVIAVGRINTPQVAEEIVSNDKADLVAIGRQLLADPLWVEKVAEGRDDKIVACLSCNTCMDSLAAGGDIACAVNPSLGKEAERA